MTKDSKGEEGGRIPNNVEGVSQDLNFSPRSRDESNRGGDGHLNDTEPNKKARLSAVNEDVDNTFLDDSIQLSGTSRTTVVSKTAPGGLGFPKADMPSKNLQCGAMWLCMRQEDDDSVLTNVDSTCVCVDCGFTAHRECSDRLFVQQPKKEGHYDYHLHLSKEGKTKVSKYVGDRDDIMICLLCMSKIETRIVAKTKTPSAPTKSKQKQQQSFEKSLKSMVVELRNLAIFHALAFVFHQDRCSNNDKMEKLRSIFHGNDKRKGTAQQVLDGDGPFAHLYEMCEGSSEFIVVETCHCTLFLENISSYQT